MDYSTAIETARRASSRRRSSAWARVPEDVLGLPLSPITPATFDLLHGTGNAFVCGGVPALADVRNFILFHSRGFDPDSPTARFFPRFRIRLCIERALCPTFTPPKRRAAIIAENLRRAVQEIRDIVTATWADALPGNDDADSGPTLAASLHAQLADMFAREYHHWPHPLPLRHTPISQLFQLARCVDRHHLGSSAVYYDRDEAALLRDFLRDANAARMAQGSNVTENQGAN
jgi:hypothetical protein